MLAKLSKQADTSLILVIIIGLGLSLFAFVYVKDWEQAQITKVHKEKVNSYVHSLRQALVTIDNLLDSVQGLYNISDTISRHHFREFLKDKNFQQYGIQAIEWIPYIPHEQRTDLEQQMQQDGITNFRIWEYNALDEKQTVLSHKYYYPILFTEPITDQINQQCIGYDVGSEPTLRNALEIAQNTGRMSSSGAVSVVGKNSLGFRSFIPIYQRYTEHNTPETRQQTIRGFIVSLVLFEDLIETVLRLPKQRSDIFVKIVDTSPDAQRKILYLPSWFKSTDSLIELQKAPLEHAGRSWAIILATIPQQQRFHLSYAWIVLVTGFLFTVGLWRYLFLTLTRAHWAEELVAARTQSLLEVNNALDESRRRFEAVFDEAAMGIAQTDLDGTILDSNKALQDLLGYSEQELQGKNLHYLAHEEDIDIDEVMRNKMLSGLCDSYTVGKRYRSKLNESIWTNQNCSIVRETVHPFIVAMIEDVTERKCAEQARLEAEKKYRDIFENAIEGIFQCTPSGHYLSVNPAFVRIFGYRSAQDMFSKINDIGQQLYVDPQRHAEFIQLLQTNPKVQNFEYEARCADGNTIWVSETVRVVRDENDEVRYYEGIVENITERKQIEEKLRYDASHDQLTGLFNRAAFTERLTLKLQQLHNQHTDNKKNEIPFVVLFADLDRFKIVNDSMGHLAGDELLTQIAKRLQAELSSHTSEMVARFGGDEFAMMLEKQPGTEVLEQRIEKIQCQLCQPYFLENETFNTTVSIGIALGSENYKNANEILRDADTAMYEAKKHGRGKAILFQPGMHTSVLNLLRMESDLRKALDREEFIVYYQPIISLETKSTIGFEALVRWMHPERGLVPPDEFIPIAEETGLIREIGLWVFKTACQQLREWQQKFPQFAELGININVSPIQLKQPRLVQEIQDILDFTGVKGPCCRVEITESAIMQDPETILKMLNDLKRLNVLLYIDDFGTGYTSLSYLKKFPVDALKIDKSFISEIRHPQDKPTQIAEAIIALGAAFDLKVVAEGVENDFQMSVLQAAHCDHVQGYLFSRPRCSIETENYLSKQFPILPPAA